MLNRSEIMKAAWAAYNRFRFLIPGQPRAFNRADFNWKLRQAWQVAKQAAMTPIERRVDAIKAEINGLRFKPLRIDIGAQETALQAELATLEAA